MPRHMVHISSRCALAAMLVCGLATQTLAQLQLGTIDGTLVGPDGQPAEGIVSLVDDLGDPVATVQSVDGRFRFLNVAPGTYSLRAEAPPLAARRRSLSVAGAIPVVVELQLSAVLTEAIEVRATDLEPAPTTSRVTLSGRTVRRVPTRIRSRGVQEAVATVPGWATEDNGLLHVRGEDDGILYVIDGVPVYERLDGLFGLAPDPATIDSMNVLTGFVPAEFGAKSGGVVEIRSAAPPTAGWLGALDVRGGSDATHELSGLLGGPAGPVALTGGLSGRRSARYLDPVYPDNLHNDGGTLSGGAQVTWAFSGVGTLSALAGFDRADFDVTHGRAQEDAGQDQRQRLRQGWTTLSWQHSWSANTVSQVAQYLRFSSSQLRGSARDTPLFTGADRRLTRLGGLASLTHQRGRHLFKVGVEATALSLDEDFTFAVTDPEAAEEAGLSEGALAYTLDKPFRLTETANPDLYAVYVQDSIRVADHVTIDVGLRADWSRLLSRAFQASPRVGASYRWASTGTTVRGSVARFFQPPQPENLLLASSPEARALSPFVEEGDAGGADVRPERQTALEVAVAQPIGRSLRLDVAHWRRRIVYAADPNVFFGTTLVFPNTVARGEASGIDVRLEMPRLGGWSAYLSYTNSRVEQVGPVNGGLFLEDDLGDLGPGVVFTPDHDQRNVGAAGITYDHGPSGTWASLSGRYESGTPLEVGDESLEHLQRRPGAELVDFDRGRVKPRYTLDAMASARVRNTARLAVDLRLAVLNLTGHRWAYNFGNPFSGTHFGPGRTISASLHVDVR